MKTNTLFSAACCAVLPTAHAIQLSLDSPQSIRDASAKITEKMVAWYQGNSFQIPGLLPGPYYWWESGAMFGSLIDYWYYTGDEQYNALVTEGLLFQVSCDTGRVCLRGAEGIRIRIRGNLRHGGSRPSLRFECERLTDRV